MPAGTHTRARAHHRTRRACSDASRMRTRACIRHSLRRTGVVRAGCAEPRARGRAADVRRVPAGTPGGLEHPSPCGLEYPLTGAETPPPHCRSAELCGRVIGARPTHVSPASAGLLQHTPGALTMYRACGPSVTAYPASALVCAASHRGWRRAVPHQEDKAVGRTVGRCKRRR